MSDDLPEGWTSRVWTSEDLWLSTELSAADYARGRLVEFNYYYKSFSLKGWWGDDAGYPGRFVYQVYECPDDVDLDVSENLEWSEITLSEEGTRKQVRILVGREMGRVLELKFQRVPPTGDLKGLFTLKGEDCARFVELVRSLEYLPVDGTEDGQRISGELVRRVLTHPDTIQAAYEQDPERVAALISSDATASDVIAIESRREAVRVFRRLLEDDEFFAARMAEINATGREKVWQNFLEANPWILGVGLSGQLLTGWDPNKLEQVVRGSSIAGSGKRVDALMRTVGVLNSMVFAEIKHDQTALLHRVQDPYRAECWAPSPELSGGVTQIQQTVYLAREDLDERVRSTDADGVETGDVTFMIRPRSYLIAGNLKELAPDGNVHMPKVRSFELFRRNLYEPEIITFDELLARAEWHLAEAERVTQEGA